jgi:hypothetical protein
LVQYLLPKTRGVLLHGFHLKEIGESVRKTVRVVTTVLAV